MNISEVAAFSGLPPKTIRYYEDIGLVRPARRENGYRAFSAADAHKLAYLARARSLGFSIEDCRALLELYEDRNRASADVKRIASQHVAGIERKIEELTAMRDTLRHLIEHCHGDDRPECPIIDSLAGAPDASRPRPSQPREIAGLKPITPVSS